MKKWFTAFIIAGGLATPIACDEASTAFDCQEVCSRYQSCFDSTYDVSACRDRCRAKAADDKSWKNKADTCHACIDDRSCTEATFSCTTECVGIVP